MSLHIFLASRSWIGGDQLHLLRLGLDFSLNNHLQPFGKLTTGAGTNPGVLLQLSARAPLESLPHYQAPMILIILLHIIVGILVIRVISKGFGERAGFFCVLGYWLSPWRLYNAGFLWKPAYVFLPAAMHFWACWKLREKPEWFRSAVLLASLVVAVQLHNSAFVLILLTVLLYFRKLIRINLTGAFAARIRAACLPHANCLFPEHGNANLLEVAALIGSSLFVISPDTSIIHFASAMKRPVLGLYTTVKIDPEWLPHQVQHTILTAPTDRPACEISEESIVREIDALVKATQSHPSGDAP